MAQTIKETFTGEDIAKFSTVLILTLVGLLVFGFLALIWGGAGVLGGLYQGAFVKTLGAVATGAWAKVAALAALV